MELHPPLHPGVVAIEKGAFGSPLTTYLHNKFRVDIFSGIRGIFPFFFLLLILFLLRLYFLLLLLLLLLLLAQSARAVEYTDCFSAEELDSSNKFPNYDSKPSDDEVPVMQELWEMQSIPSVPSLPDPLWPGVVAPDRILSLGQTVMKCVLMLELKFILLLNWITWNRSVLRFKLRTYAKLNCLKWNCFCMLSWIV